jgi:gas vesicle structural protein
MSRSELAEHVSLCDALDRILTKGVVLHGDIGISVAGVDLLHISLRGLISAVDVIQQNRDDHAREQRNTARQNAVQYSTGQHSTVQPMRVQLGAGHAS